MSVVLYTVQFVYDLFLIPLSLRHSYKIHEIYVRMYLCMYVRMYVCMYTCMYVCMYVRTYVCMYTCMYVRMYVC